MKQEEVEEVVVVTTVSVENEVEEDEVVVDMKGVGGDDIGGGCEVEEEE